MERLNRESVVLGEYRLEGHVRLPTRPWVTFPLHP